MRLIVGSSIHRAHVNPDESAEHLLSAWAGAAREALVASSVHHIGIAMPGPFEYNTGVSRLQHKFASLHDVNVGIALQERLNTTLPIYFGNDASLFALGEWWAGAAKGFDRVIGVTLGTGLGGGFVANGRVYYSGEGVPAEGGIWNLSYLKGIAEDYVSGPALVKSYQTKTGKTLNPAEIAKAARDDDTSAREVYLELGFHLGRILGPWVKAFDAHCIVVGGNIARSFDLFEKSLEEALNSQVNLVISTLFEEAALFGAAALGLKV
jgi:glucokinase